MRNIIDWSYERASWQWDLLCLAILAFIFLTPKGWFATEERSATPNPAKTVKVATAAER
jgi:hypothetical protein